MSAVIWNYQKLNSKYIMDSNRNSKQNKGSGSRGNQSGSQNTNQSERTNQSGSQRESKNQNNRNS